MVESMLNNSVFVIPCYNEENRMDIDQYSSSLKNNDQIHILFVNDGSSDSTLKVLEKLKVDFNAQIEILNLSNNKGKAEAVRQGVQNALQKNVDIVHIGYFDADLSTSLEEGISLFNQLTQHEQLKFAFGSRISRVGSTIIRKNYRHLVGRFIATIISNILKLRVYDTQCGAKVFTKELAQFVFDKPFISKWLFDVEIFARMLCETSKYSIKNMLEVPLTQWIDTDGSKVKWSYSFKLFIDLFKIWSSYPCLRKRPKMI